MAESELRKKLLKDLRDLIKKVPDEGLAFLIQQANTLLYNKRVHDLNEVKKQIDPKTAVRKPKKGVKVPEGEFMVERGEFANSFIMTLRTQRKTFSYDEMSSLIQASFSGDSSTSKDAPGRIYRWLNKYRDDVLLDVGVRSPRDPLMNEMASYFKKNFSFVK
jgi:hypothetical protein